MSVRRVLGVLVLTGLVGSQVAAGEFEQGKEIAELGHVLRLRERVEPTNRMLVDRLDNLLPELMRETGIDLWLVINREYVEDPVYLTLVPEPVFAARRTTMLVFHDRGPEHGVDLLTVSRSTPCSGPRSWKTSIVVRRAANTGSGTSVR